MKKPIRSILLYKLVLAVVLLLFSISYINAQTPTKLENEGYPVLLNHKEIFRLYSGYKHISVEERVAIIEARLEAIKYNETITPDSLAIVKQGDEIIIAYAGSPIIYITDDDSDVLGKDRMDIAEDYAEKIKVELLPLLHSLSLKSQIFSISIIVALILLILSVTYYVVKLVKRVWHKFESFLFNIIKKHPQGVQIRSVKFISYAQINRLTSIFLKLINFIIYVFIFYNAVYFILYVIPATQNIARQLQYYLTRPLFTISKSFFNYLPNVFFIIIVLFISKYVIKFLRYFFNEIEKGHIKFKGFFPEWADSTFQIAKFLIYFFVAVIIFPYLPGADSPAFKGISIFVGVLFSLGSSSAIANMVAGIILTYMRAFKVGDFVRIGDTQGELVESSLLVVKIKTFQNIEVTIPNSIVLSGQIHDFSKHSKDKGVAAQLKVEIGFDVPWTLVHELLIKSAKVTQDIRGDIEPFVLQTALSESVVQYELNAFVDNPFKLRRATSELYGNIVQIFNENNIDLICHLHIVSE
ncbi:MAG TPA: mechanosensitive ion channel [Candidatus Cloacimonadota bacterium]|nr:mechanosensitive ion channel [Candidatus Cloacimonadota bacterium]